MATQTRTATKRTHRSAQRIAAEREARRRKLLLAGSVAAAVVGHSLDFHSAKTAPDQSYRTLNPGEEFSYSFVAKYPGAYMYHCGTPPILMHLGAGMYGSMIVDPKEGWSPAQEITLVQSEYYLADDGTGTGTMTADYMKMLGNSTSDYCVFNGYANQYADNPIAVEVKAPVRVFVMTPGRMPGRASTWSERSSTVC